MREKRKIVELDSKLANRSVNEGFSGGEKKRNEIFQMAMLEPKLAILDETDSGLDVDALRIVAEGVNKLKTDETSYRHYPLRTIAGDDQTGCDTCSIQRSTGEDSRTGTSIGDRQTRFTTGSKERSGRRMIWEVNNNISTFTGNADMIFGHSAEQMNTVR